MGTPDSREYDRLVERNFQPYSRGHRQMYEWAMDDLKARGFGYLPNVPLAPYASLAEPPGQQTFKAPHAAVLEAGFGIGWGLEQMLAEPGLLYSYVGYEPNKDAYDYVVGRHQHRGELAGKMAFFNLPFQPNLEPIFDAALCIEVIEHVPADQHRDFIRGLCAMAPVLYFSTPDIRRDPSEGVRTTEEWTDMLFSAGFDKVRARNASAAIWTTFYKAERL
jgi:hypothetical protein